MNIVAPTDDGSDYPTLGPQVVEWMHENLVFGPGDLLGQPLRLDEEQQWFIWRFYELFPRGHEQAGRRRFQRCALSLAKGLRKTELAACVAAAELAPEAPVRFAGWVGKRGSELAQGKGLTDPFIVLMATTEQQSNELAYAALCEIIKGGPLARDFDIGQERIERLRGGRGKAVSVAGNPSAQDGARTTFELFDETHHLVLPRQIDAHQTMLANLPKRPLADPWALETTTAPQPGAGSVAEATMDYGKAVANGTIKDASLFYFHRQASDYHDLKTMDGRKAAIAEASGVHAAKWRDIHRVAAKWDDPSADLAFLERVWLNRLVQQSRQAFDVELWKSLERKDYRPEFGSVITLGFDGSKSNDSTGLVGTDAITGFQFKLGLWECPIDKREWRVPVDEVDAVVRQAFEHYTVVAFYCDPPYWQEMVAKWQAEWSKDIVHEWWTNRRKPMTVALEGFTTAMKDGSICHGGDPDLKRHIANARRADLTMLDEQGKPLWLICKERVDSPLKIDLAMAAVLSWEARTDAIAQGLVRTSAYETERQVWF